jgi:cobalt-zinc-cadmium efflux system membrane fusion protein
MVLPRKTPPLAIVGSIAAFALTIGIGYGIAKLSPGKSPAGVQTTTEDAHASEAEHAGETDHIEMDATRLAASGVELIPAAAGALAGEVSAQGTVAPQPQGEAVLAARADGVITRINRRLGDQVRPGEAIATIESREASTIAAERASAAARAIVARQALEREQRLFNAGITPRQDLEGAQAARTQADAEVRRTTAAASAARLSSDGRSVTVVSPIGGRVTAAPAILGAFVTAGAELFRVADPTRIQIEAAVAAADALRVSPGDTATVQVGNSRLPATVRSITPGLGAETRAAIAVLDVQGNASLLRPGQAVAVRITSRTVAASPGRIVVPEEAVQSVEGQDAVFVRNAEGFVVAPVVVASRGGGRAEISSGLKPGQTIAGKGAFVLKAELGKGEAEHAH